MNSLNPVRFQIKTERLQTEPKPHKILKKSIQITLNSASKKKMSTQIEKDQIRSQANRFSQSLVNKNNQSNKALKRQIDSRLNKVYSNLPRLTSINLFSEKIKPTNTQQISLSLKNQHKQAVFNSINKKNPQTYEDLPYELLKRYIQTIYTEYQIQDPLALTYSQNKSINNYQPTLYTPDKKQKMYDTTLSTKKKILIMKNKFINELHSATKKKDGIQLGGTPKKLVIDNYLIKQQQQSSPKKVINRTPIGIATKRKLQTTLKSQISPNSNEVVIPPFINIVSSEQILTGQKYYRNDPLSDTKMSFSDSNFFNSSSQKLNGEFWFSPSQFRTKVPQKFRYCFVCEEPILQYNTSMHQRECRGLNQILSDQTLTRDKMLNMLNIKIKKIQDQIENIFLKSDQKETSSKLEQLKQKVSNWIHSINSENDNKVPYQKRISLNKYSFIKQDILSTNLIQAFQLMKKLDWFIHMRKNTQDVSPNA